MAKADTQLRKLIRETPLAELVDVGVLQRMQDRFAEVTGVSVVIRDLQGRPVTRPSCQNAFCSLMTGSQYGETSCRESNRRAVARAAEEHRVVKYVCHAGLSQFAAPIEVENTCVGTIVTGDQPEGQVSAARISQMARRSGIPEKKLRSALNTVRPWSEAEMTQAITLLVSITNGVAGLCYQGAELRAKLREISTLYEVSKLLAGTLDLNQLLKLVAKSATEAAGAKGCSIRLLDAQGKRLVIKSFYNLSQRYLDKGPVLVERSAIDRAALKGEVVQTFDMLHDPRVTYPKEAQAEGIRSGISLGLISKKRPIGTLHLYTAEQRHFDADQVQVLRSLANQAAVAIENAQLYQQSIEKRKLDRELRWAGRIQEQLLPERPPTVTGFDIAAQSIPCSEVGGDFYDFIRIKNDRVAFVIADVAGKGVPAALLMASARAALRAHLESTTEPRQLMRRLNKNLCHDSRSGQFVSLFCGVLDPARRVVSYTNAGHNPPLVIRGGRAEPLEKGGMVLGADLGEDYEQADVPLRRGDLLVFYTDGVTEALNPQGEIFGLKRLLHLLRRVGDAGADEIVKRIFAAVREFAAGAPQSDDISLIVLRVE